MTACCQYKTIVKRLLFERHYATNRPHRLMVHESRSFFAMRNLREFTSSEVCWVPFTLREGLVA
jgi:hypothetical protein